MWPFTMDVYSTLDKPTLANQAQLTNGQYTPVTKTHVACHLDSAH